MTTALAGRVAKATITDAALHTLIEEAGANASRRAAQLLGIDADAEHGDQDWHRVLVKHARQSPVTLVKTAMAVVAAHGARNDSAAATDSPRPNARCSAALATSRRRGVPRERPQRHRGPERPATADDT
jgi:hypothetical protein